MKNGLKTALFYIILTIVILISITSLFNSIPKETLVYSDVVELFNS